MGVTRHARVHTPLPVVVDKIWSVALATAVPPICPLANFYRLGGLYWVTSGALDSCHANMPTEIFLSQQVSYTLDVSGAVDSWPVILSTGSFDVDLIDVHKQRVEPWTAATSLC